MQPLLMYLTARGHESSTFLRAQGVDPTIFRDAEARLPHAVAVTLWPAAVRLTNDQDLGLHVAEGVRPGDYGALEYAVRTSETLGIGLQRLCLYQHFIHDGAEVKLTVDDERAILSHRLPGAVPLPRAVSEYIVAAWLVTFRQATISSSRVVQTPRSCSTTLRRTRIPRLPLSVGWISPLRRGWAHLPFLNYSERILLRSTVISPECRSLSWATPARDVAASTRRARRGNLGEEEACRKVQALRLRIRHLPENQIPGSWACPAKNSWGHQRYPTPVKARQIPDRT